MSRPGLGAPGAAPNLPPPINLSVERYSIFVGSIAEGVDDAALEKALSVAGPLVALNRVKDANGKPKAFGFAEYTDPAVVSILLTVLNGQELWGKTGQSKPVVLKADEKTNARLDHWKQSQDGTPAEDTKLAWARDQLADVIARMKNPSLGGFESTLNTTAPKVTADDIRARIAGTSAGDLAPDELPEESRGLITREIAFFRERAAQRAREKAKAEAEAESPASATSNPGWASRGQANNNAAPSPQQSQPPTGPRQNRNGSQSRPPQNGFVPSSSSSQQRTDEPMPVDQVDDEEAEMTRIRRKKENIDRQFHQRLQRIEQRERARIQRIDNEQSRDLHAVDDDKRRKSEVSKKLEHFDDDLEAERGRELFYTDRARWRAQRRLFRNREIEGDQRDARQEEREALHASKQPDPSQKAKDDAEARGIKLAVPSAPAEEPTPVQTKKPALLVTEDDEYTRRKRELIKLDYSNMKEYEVEEERGMTDKEKLERRSRLVRNLVSEIPADKDGLYKMGVRWAQLSDNLLRNKLQPFIAKKTVEYLGAEDDDMVNVILDHLKAHKDAPSLIEEVEPVLAEDAEEMVIKIWRMLVFECLAAERGIALPVPT